MLYHVSPNSGLKTLYPHESTHKKAYVYAAGNFVVGILFGVKQDDFDLVCDKEVKVQNEIRIVARGYSK